MDTFFTLDYIIKTLATSTGIGIVIFFILKTVLTEKIKASIKHDYDKELEAYKVNLKTEADKVLEKYKAELKTDNETKFETYKQSLASTYTRDIENHKAALKKAGDMELERLKFDLRRFEIEQPKRIEALKNLILLCDKVVPAKTHEDMDLEEAILIVGQKFDDYEKQIKEFLQNNVGVLDTQTELNLKACVNFCADGKFEILSNGNLSNHGEELANAVIEYIIKARTSFTTFIGKQEV